MKNFESASFAVESYSVSREHAKLRELTIFDGENWIVNFFVKLT